MGEPLGLGEDARAPALAHRLAAGVCERACARRPDMLKFENNARAATTPLGDLRNAGEKGELQARIRN